MRPDPERFHPIKEIPILRNLKTLRHCMRFLAYYAQWIPSLAKKVKTLTASPTFPLGGKAAKAFEDLKMDKVMSVVTAIEETIPFAVETDTSEAAIATT